MAPRGDVSSQTSYAVADPTTTRHQGLLIDFLTVWNSLIGYLWPLEDSKMVKRVLDLFLIGSTLSKGIAAQCAPANNSQIDLKWHAPNATAINDLKTVVNGTGIYGFTFNSSATPATSGYDTYNWCNMPHVRRQEYVVPPSDFKLEYVEVVGIHFLSNLKEKRINPS